MTDTNLNSWATALQNNKNIFPHQLDMIGDKVLLIELNDIQKKQASFLDQRILSSQTKGAWISWADVMSHTPKAPGQSLNYIFHVGHCGSTLISRLLDELSGHQSLREPLALRNFAQEKCDQQDGSQFWTEAEYIRKLDTLNAIWARTNCATTIKTTSICTDLIADVKKCNTTHKVLFLYLTAEQYLTTLLGGENAWQDLRGFAQLRIRRLNKAQSVATELSNLSLGELAAASWLVEILTAKQHLSSTDLRLNFDIFLNNKEEQLQNIIQYLDLNASHSHIDNITNGPLMQQYSKAPEHKYSADFREQILIQSRRQNAEEILKGLKWLQAMGGKDLTVGSAIEKYAQL